MIFDCAGQSTMTSCWTPLMCLCTAGTCHPRLYLLMGPTRQLFLDRSISLMSSGKQKECLIFHLRQEYSQMFCSYQAMDFPDLEVLTSQLLLLGMLERQKSSGLSKGFLTPKWQKGRQVHLFLPLLLWVSSPGMFCCNPRYFNAVNCRLLLQSGVIILGTHSAT